MADEKDGLMEKAVIGGVIALVMIMLVSQAVQAYQPAPPGYCCPICPDECFYTYEELYEHFTTAHPSQPIDLIWE